MAARRMDAQRSRLAEWFKENRREFPWRQEVNPYRVWISEVMLQQTRASVVIPYFARWMEVFPDVKRLYKASLEEVIKAWEGLGYYRRARHLHEGAKQIVEAFGGKLPETEKDLRKIRGIGAYTAGAILSFAFHKKAPAIDGNVLRVMTRLEGIEGRLDLGWVKKAVFEAVSLWIEGEEPWILMEALIELGATLCAPTPRCELCPLQDGCLARAMGKERLLPLKKEEKRMIPLEREVLIFLQERHVLVRKNLSGELMGDLYEFPYLEGRSGKNPWYPNGASLLKRLPSVSHAFTQYKARLFPFVYQVEERRSFPGWEWVMWKDLSSRPFSSGHRKILLNLRSEIFSKLV